MKRRQTRHVLPALLLLALSLSACHDLTPGVRYDGLNAYAVAESVARAASVYDPSITTDSLLEKTTAYADQLTSKTKDQAIKATYKDMYLLLHQAFEGFLPEHIGARTFQAYVLPREQIVGYSKLDEKTKASFDWIRSRGLISNPMALSDGAVLSESSVRTMLDRFHAYIGESYVDDFFTTVNHDYLYDDCDIQEEDPNSPNRIYDSRLIPQNHINAWAKNLLPIAPAAKNFNDSFMDAEARTEGKLAGLREMLDRLLAATTIDEFVELLQQEAIDTGYCPLWSSLEFSEETLYSGEQTIYRKIAKASCFNSDQPSAIYEEGYGSADDEDDSYARSVARFKPIFQEGLAISESAAEAYAKDYTHFKYLFCKAREEILEREGDGILSAGDSINLGSKLLPDFIKALGIEEPTWFMWESSAHAKALLSLFEKEENLPYLKGFAIWQLFAHYSSCLPAGEAIKNWAFSGRYSTDEEGLENDALWGAFCLPHISGILSNRFAATESYDEQIGVFVGLLEDLKNAMGERIQNEDWLSQEAKEAASKKLATLRYSIGGTNSDGTHLSYAEPAYLANASLYENLSIEENGAFDEAALHLGEDWAEERGGADKIDFFGYCQKQDPLTANAFYWSVANGIDIYLGYIAAYDDVRTAAKETFLATFGRTLGHELSHAFDSNGMSFDENGKWNNKFIPEEDRIRFQDRVGLVADSYQGYEVLPGKETSGGTVVGEAIADITGATLCLDMAKKIPGFDYRAFFLDAAKDMACYVSQRTYDELLAADSHPVGRARINTCFRLLDEFHETFQTKEGDGMYLTPADRCRVW